MDKVRVAVLRGGPSEEYDVSLKTGAAVLDSLDPLRYHPVDVVITRSGEWLTQGYVRFPEQVLSSADVVFIALHGAYGEDGTVQKLLDRYAIPYTGSKAFASSIAIHKVLTKETLKDSGIRMSPHFVVSRSSLPHLHTIVERIESMFGPRYVIKPISSGSSVGTMMADSITDLAHSLRGAFGVYDKVLVEKRIVGKEATCGVVENFRDQLIYALPVIEIVPPQSAQFFDNTVKYDNSTEEICPGRFPRSIKEEIESASKKVHEILGLSQYSRSDFMISDEGVYFLEVNTLPGLTKESLFPKAVEAVGSTYGEFITHLLNDALLR